MVFSAILTYFLYTYQAKLHTSREGIRRQFPDAFLFCRNNLVKENKRPLSGKNMECIGGDFILDQKTPERNMQHYLWLSYFNRTLRDQGVITMDEYRKMNHLIWTKYQVLKKV